MTWEQEIQLAVQAERERADKAEFRANRAESRANRAESRADEYAAILRQHGLLKD